jgi:hypothetical protein
MRAEIKFTCSQLCLTGVILWLLGCGTDIIIADEHGAGDQPSDSTSDDSETTPAIVDTASRSDSDVDTESDTSTDTDPLSTDSDSGETGTDSGTLLPCPDSDQLGTTVLSPNNAPGFEHFGEPSITWNAQAEGPVQGILGLWVIQTGEIPATTAGVQLHHTIPSPISENDLLLAQFWTRCVDSATGMCNIGFLVEQLGVPWKNIVSWFTQIDENWQFHEVPFVATDSFAPGESQETFRLGYENQTIEVYPVRLTNYGPVNTSTRMDCLPDTTALTADPPDFLRPAPQNAFVDILYDYFAEIKGTPSGTVTAAGLPEWLHFDADRLRLFGAPGYDDVGTTGDITLESSNPGGSSSQQFKIDVVVDPALLGHWPLDESSGTTASDASGNARNGIVFGDPNWQPSDGRINGALHCDSYSGEVDYVLLPTDNEMDTVQDGPHTLAAWVRVMSSPASQTDPDAAFGYGILIKADPPIGLWYDADQQFNATYHFENNSYTLTAPAIAPGEFHHVAAVFNPANLSYELFIDGNRAANSTLRSNGTYRDFGLTHWRIGLADADSTSLSLHSDIIVDDVRIYSRALTNHEIRSLAIDWETEATQSPAP